jgi:hypothetical protein
VEFETPSEQMFFLPITPDRWKGEYFPSITLKPGEILLRRSDRYGGQPDTLLGWGLTDCMHAKLPGREAAWSG